METNFKFPKVLASSVVRSTVKGNAHGGLFIVDLETNLFKKVLDWDDDEINWEGRGGDRGLRGICFYKEYCIIASTNTVFFFDSSFTIIKSFKNQYLESCHEIFIHDHLLYLSSTNYDSIIIFDLKIEKFIDAFCVRPKRQSILRRILNKLLPNNQKYQLINFDPNSRGGPKKSDRMHFNNVFFSADLGICFTSLRSNFLFSILNNKLVLKDLIPVGTHNVQFLGTKLLFNSTKDDRIGIVDIINNKNDYWFEVTTYDETEIEKNDIPADHARQGFARGLCYTDEELIIVGSSPATISVYHRSHGRKPLKTINLTMDVRHAIHGLEIIPEAFLS